MTVSVNRTPKVTTLTWTRTDDPQSYIAQAVESGHLEAALTVLGLQDYYDLATLPKAQRAKLLRHTAALANELTRRVRHLTVAHRHHGASWEELALLLVSDSEAHGTAYSTYNAGLRQMGLTSTGAGTADARSS
ncbi:hypothetical protein QQY24_30800 [Streptomyces sp. TG1A-8]|uniref:hypothetical protein n=1 Tax=Streptomyces sp. TG1A-8 TaxID=3051385 RepID=UPI00265C7C2D|nr:hypothetical protein [Streptomyces sp. TG1A-8]MDO0929553.1 hypothetical protein [Streptomyces sp. TG1A-8]